MSKIFYISTLISGCLSILILISGCKHKRMRANQLSEAGGIMPKEYNFPLNMNELKISALKLCPRYNFANCSTATVISRDGYVLVSKHSIEGDWAKLKMNIDLKKRVKKQQDQVLVLDLNSWDKEVVTPMVFEFEIVAVGKYDISLIRVIDPNEFNKWTVPFQMKYELPQSDTRIFSAGYAKSNYRPEIIKQAFENYRNQHEEFYGVKPTRTIDQFIYPNRELLLTTGRIVQNEYFVKSSDHTIPWDTPYAGRYALDTIGGMSGGPIFNKEAQVIGIISGGVKYSRSDSKNENLSSVDTSGSKLIISTDITVPKKDRTKTINIVEEVEFIEDETLDKLRKDVLNRIEERNIKNKEEVKLQTKKSFGYLKSIRKNKGMINFPYLLKCKTLGSSDHIGANSSNIKSPVYQGHEVSIKSIKYEILNTEETKIWFKSERLAKEKFFGWFKFNDWSPVYNVKTAMLLDGIVHQNRLKETVDFNGSKIELKGFTPYLIDKNLWTREVSSPSFRIPNIFIQSMLHDKIPSDDKGERYGEWYWVISECLK